MVFNQRLRQLRKECDLSQEELAKILDTDRSNVANWETRRQPDYNIIKKISEYFNVTTDYLLGVTDEKGGKVEVTFSLTNGTTVNDLSEMLSQLSPDDQQLIFNMINSLIKKDKK
jgi:transcriptional regulator with XRE-family HTH domain